MVLPESIRAIANDYVIIDSLGQAKSRLSEYKEANKLFYRHDRNAPARLENTK